MKQKGKQQDSDTNWWTDAYNNHSLQIEKPISEFSIQDRQIAILNEVLRLGHINEETR